MTPTEKIAVEALRRISTRDGEKSFFGVPGNTVTFDAHGALPAVSMSNFTADNAVAIATAALTRIDAERSGSTVGFTCDHLQIEAEERQ